MIASPTPCYEFPACKSPTTNIALQDVVSCNPNESRFPDDHVLCRVESAQSVLTLPLRADVRVEAGTVALNALQRKTLQCALRDNITLSLVESDLPKVSKVWVTVRAQKETDQTVPTLRIVHQFKSRFKAHPLNKGHTVPLRLDDITYLITVDRMVGFSEDLKGVMKSNCQIIPTFR